MNVMFVYAHLQETSKLFEDMAEVALEKASKRKKELMDLFVECNIVGLVQNVWRKSLDQKLREQNKDLPPPVHTTLTVIVSFIVIITIIIILY